MRMFVDTNVFLYAVGAANPLRDPCEALIRRIAKGALRATTSAEVVQEILHVAIRREHRERGLGLAIRTVLLFPDLLPVTRDDVRTACDLLSRYRALPARDAIHVATMLSNGITSIISADPHFDRITEVRRIPPDRA